MKDTRSWTPLQGLYDWERRQPEAIYLSQPVDGVVTDYSWAQAADQVRRIAAHLHSLQLPPGSHIALLSKNSAHWILADLAIWMAGHISVPIYPSLNSDTLSYILEHSEARLLFLGHLDDWAQMRSGITPDLPVIALPRTPQDEQPPASRRWNELLGSTEPLAGTVVRQPEEVATMMYTSGSTGKPKGVMLTFAAVAAGASISVVPVTTRDRMLSYLPLAHVLEAALVLGGSLRFGIRVFFSDSQASFMDDLRRAQPTVFFSVPRLWVKFQQGVQQKLPAHKLDRLLKIPLIGTLVRRSVLRKLGFQHVKVAGSGSAPLPASVLDWYRKLGLELLEGYGMSENFSYSHVSVPGHTRTGYVGHPLPGVQHQIGEAGEILIKSPGQMHGYFKEPQKTAEVYTADGWFRTGDMGEIDAQGRLKITGRLKEMFKSSKGKYVAPAPIENKLLSHPHVEAVCVTGANQPQPIALLMLNAEAQKALENSAYRSKLEEELQQLLKHVNATLDGHEQLAFLVVVNEQWTIANNFLTPTLKIKRHALEMRYDGFIEQWAQVRRPIVWDQSAAH